MVRTVQLLETYLTANMCPFSTLFEGRCNRAKHLSQNFSGYVIAFLKPLEN